MNEIKQVSNSNGAFHKSELAGRTMVRPGILEMKQAFSKRIYWKTISFEHNV